VAVGREEHYGKVAHTDSMINDIGKVAHNKGKSWRDLTMVDGKRLNI
jgi:hypothetical protein